MTMTINGSSGLIFPDGSGQESGIGRNRIINGDMVISQRNGTSSVTPAAAVATYTLDRFYCYPTQASKLTIQQNAGSVTPPAGFTNYLGVTSSSSYTPLSTDAFILVQPIEGFNTADLAFGTANARTVTLSFWVRSSLTGTFGGNIQNAAETQCYPFNYTISAANTWEQKTITIAGSTTGTWNTNNTVGMYVVWDLGSGSNQKGTVNTWQSGPKYAPTGSNNLISTNGATFYITGVQLEQNTSATPFERRLYGQELANCQRYYQTFGNYEGTGVAKDTTSAFFFYQLSSTMRASTTCVFTCPAVDRIGVALTSTTGTGIVFSTDNMVVSYATVTLSGMGQPCSPASGTLLTVSAEL
jgi:hypothetical protein